MTTTPNPQGGMTYLQMRREEDLHGALAGRAPRTDSTPDVERELLLASLALATGDDDRFSRAVASAKLAGAGEDRLVDLVLLSIAVVGPARAARAAEFVRDAFGVRTGDESWLLAAMLSEVPDGTGRTVRLAGRSIALVRKGDQVVAVQSDCPHRRGPMADGILEGGTITCPLHAWTFDLATGACVGMPDASISVFEAKIEGNRIFVRA